MNSIHKMALGSALGVFVGAAAMAVLHAQTASAPAYLISNITQIKDQAMLDEYRAAAPKTEEAFGAHVLARATPVKLDSSALPEGTIAIIEFPSMKALQGWWNSPAYVAVRPLREKSTVGRLYAVEGLAH
jgi:uncharacterized protein (DUF1330 family)